MVSWRDIMLVFTLCFFAFLKSRLCRTEFETHENNQAAPFEPMDKLWQQAWLFASHYLALINSMVNPSLRTLDPFNPWAVIKNAHASPAVHESHAAGLVPRL